MKIKWVLMSLILMVSLTGISATTDLTANSELAFNLDNDVGQVETLLVAQEVVLLEVKTQVVEVPTFTLKYADRNYAYNLNYVSELVEDVKPPDLDITTEYTLHRLTSRTNTHNHRLARDGFDCT